MRPRPELGLSLAGSRAPSYHQRHVSKTTAMLDVLARASGWITAFSTQWSLAPEQPLLGTCLAELTGAAPVSVASESGPSRSRGRKTVSTPSVAGVLDAASGEGVQHTRNSNRPGPKKATSSCAAPEVARTSTRTADTGAQADLACVRRNTSHPARKTLDRGTLVRMGKFTDHRGIPNQGVSTAAKLSVSKQTGCATMPHPPSRAVICPPKEWVRQFAAHALVPLLGDFAGADGPISQRKLVTPIAGISAPVGVPPVTEAIEPTHQSAAAQARLEQRLCAQWSTLLDGPRFPAEELARLAGNPGSPASRDAARAAPPPTRSHPPTPGASSSAGSPVVPPSAEVANHPVAVAGSESEAATHNRSGSNLPAITEGTSAAPEYSPWSREPLRTVRTPPTPGIARHRLPVMEVAPSTHDDLSVLSTNIQRILEEEARRYGIDV